MRLTPPPQEPLPSHIGPFRIAGVLGEGAMGRVYLAEQDEPRREVALKVMRTAGATGRDLARFRREVELLAELEHPGIARIYASGSADTASGSVPWLAMECVRGKNLVEHAEAAGLDAEQRLRLLAELCRTVHFAHSRGVIHRDLKPSNLLVDASGQVKVLDFGIARALWNEGDTEMTQAGQVLGTLPYMSWEQLRGEAGAVDPRSDVYALGVIGYQLLAGQLPYPALSEATLVGALEQRRMHEPLPLHRLRPDLRGDVDTLVMKALSREPAQRYGSALELAEDIDRYLAHQPIQARPPSAAYLLRLLVQRHRGLSLGLGLALLAIVAGAGVALHLAGAEATARKQSELRNTQLEASNRLLARLLSSSDPNLAKGREPSVRDVLNDARAELLHDRSMAPEVRALGARAVGLAYAELGDHAKGLELMDAALAGLAGADLLDPLIRDSLTLKRALILTRAGRNGEALAGFKVWLDRSRPASPREQELWIEARGEAAAALSRDGHRDQALQLANRNAEDAVQLFGEEHHLTRAQQQLQADLLRYGDKPAQALPVLKRLIEIQTRTSGAEAPETLESVQLLALVLQGMGNSAEAEQAARSALQGRRAVLGETHYLTAQSRFLVSDILYARDPKSAEAADLMQDVLLRYQEALGPEHPSTLLAMNTTAIRLEDSGQPELALPLYERIFETQRRRGMADSVETLAPLNKHAYLLMNLGRLADAERQYRELVARGRVALGPKHLMTLIYLGNLGECLLRQRRPLEAVAVLGAALSEGEATVGLVHPRMQRIGERLSRGYRETGQATKAETLAARLASAKAGNGEP